MKSTDNYFRGMLEKNIFRTQSPIVNRVFFLMVKLKYLYTFP